MAPQGSKAAYTDKQRRQARHIEDSVRRRGGSPKAAGRIAYATINKQQGGGKRSGSGRAGSGRTRGTSSSATRRTRSTTTRSRRTAGSRRR